MIALAKYLDELHNNGLAFIVESESVISVSGLDLASAQKIFVHLKIMSLTYEIRDSEQTVWKKEELLEELCPFRISIYKEASAPNRIRVLTLEGMRHLLKNNYKAERWEISYLEKTFKTKSQIFSPWQSKDDFRPQPYKKSPRSLVRNYSSKIRPPENIAPWLLDSHEVDLSNPAFNVWANESIINLLSTLPNEIDESGLQIKFNGPPKLILTLPNDSEELLLELGNEAFLELQRAVAWVFEIDRDAESKQIFLSAEISRSANTKNTAIECIKENIGSALSGAKIAYQLALSEISKDTLKTLADLRKAVTEETAKLTESTRQVITAVAGASAVSLGLIAAKSSSTGQPWLLLFLSLMASLYVAAVAASGTHFLFLQRKIRTEWHTRIYRFLPPDEYEKMVISPTKSSETVFFATTIISLVIITILTITLVLTKSNPDMKNQTPVQEQTLEQTKNHEQNQ